jgi:hypothetical protein
MGSGQVWWWACENEGERRWRGRQGAEGEVVESDVEMGVEVRLMEALVQRGGDVSERVLAWLVDSTMPSPARADIVWIEPICE